VEGKRKRKNRKSWKEIKAEWREGGRVKRKTASVRKGKCHNMTAKLWSDVSTFLLLPIWYTNFLFIHTNYIKLNSSTCFERNPLIIRRSTTQIVHMQPLVTSLSASDRLVQPLVYQVGNNKKVVLWCTTNQISRFLISFVHQSWTVKGKNVEVYPIKIFEGPEGKWRSSCTLYLTAALDYG